VNDQRESVYAYVDGMNLYYGALKHNPGCRWLDVPSLMANLVPHLTIVHTRYYTARIKATFPGDPGPARQRTYLQALQSRPRITVKEGVYADWPRWQRLDETRGLDSPNLFRPRLKDAEARHVGRILQQAKDRQPSTRPFVLARIRQTEEKGSDVNLATDLLKDALGTRACRTALVVTNDSDLAYPLEVVHEFGVGVILVNPFLQSDQREATGLRHISCASSDATETVPPPEQPTAGPDHGSGQTVNPSHSIAIKKPTCAEGRGSSAAKNTG